MQNALENEKYVHVLPLIPDSVFEESEGSCVAVLTHDGSIEGVDLCVVGDQDLGVEATKFRNVQIVKFNMQTMEAF